MESAKRGFSTRLKRLKCSQFITGCLLVGLIGQAVAMGNERAKILAQLKAGGAQLTHNKATGKTRFIGTLPNKGLPVAGTQPHLSPAQNAHIIAQSYGPMFGIKSAETQLGLMKQATRPDGRSMVRYQQRHESIPVLGGEIIINLDGQQNLLSMNGETADTADLQNITPIITPAEAIATALAEIAQRHQTEVSKLQAGKPELYIYDPRLLGPKTGPLQLVWRLDITPLNSHLPIRELVLVNAIQGGIALHFNQLHSAKNRLTYDAGGAEDPPQYDNLPGNLVCTEGNGDTCSDGTNPDADAAHQFAGDTYDFFLNVHGRDGIDGQGGAIISSVNYCPDQFLYPGECPMTNAFWDGTQMVYGAGFAVDDVVAHELTHGFTEKTSNLFYYYQSGAISESLSDVWGEFVDLTTAHVGEDPADDWKIGEDLPLGIGAIRNMQDPKLEFHPDSMSSVYYYVGDDDEGGVHTNSGVNNKAVYLMTAAAGETHNGFTVTGIGIEKVARIYYEAQTSLLTSAADYADLYAAVNQACNNLSVTTDISAADCQQVKNALDAVEMNQDPKNLTPEAATCPVDGAASYTFFDDFEAGLGKWQLSHSSFTTADWLDWLSFFPTPYATSGTHSLFGEGIASYGDQRAQISAKIPTHIPAYLRFNHAFDFEYSGSAAYDGGVLEYSTNGGLSWNDAAPYYFDGQAYNGSILAGQNPLSTRPAFVKLSHGYVSSRYDLSPFAGQTLLLRWRIGTDTINIPPDEIFGWLLDDVAVYTCDNQAPTTVPILVSPADNAELTGTPIDYQWIDGGDDPDGDTLTHTVMICEGTDCTPDTPALVVVGMLTGPALAGLGAGGLLIFGLVRPGRRRAWLVITLAAAVMLSSSCGGGNGGGEGIGTQKKTYRWLVQADDGNGGIIQSTIRTYTISN